MHLSLPLGLYKRRRKTLAFFSMTVLVLSVISIVMSQTMLFGINNKAASAALAPTTSSGTTTTTTSSDSPLILPFSSSSVTNDTVSTTAIDSDLCDNLPMFNVKASGYQTGNPPSNA